MSERPLPAFIRWPWPQVSISECVSVCVIVLWLYTYDIGPRVLIGQSFLCVDYLWAPACLIRPCVPTLS